MKAASLVLALVFVAVACHPRLDRSASDQPQPGLFSLKFADTLDPASFSPPTPVPCLLRVERKGCGGPCEEWEARYYANGVATFIAKKGPLAPGAYSADFSPDSLGWVYAEAGQCDFFHLPDTLGFIPQLPGWSIGILQDTLSNSILHNHGGALALQRFERRLEEWILAQPWERIDR